MDKYIAQGDGFPGDNEFLMLIQSIIGDVSQLSALGGTNYILKGCEEAGGNVADGWMVLNGEIVKFEGGAVGTEVTIEETIENAVYLEDLNADDQGDSKPTYFYRLAKFGDTGVLTVDWADIDKNPLAEIKRRLPPIGCALPYSGDVDNIPEGWALFAPMAGMFVVGYDPNNEDYDEIGKTGGSDDVTLNESEMPQHNHNGNVTIPPHTHDLPNAVHAHGGSGSNRLTNTNNTGHTDVTKTSPSASMSAQITTVNKGGSQPHENRPSYYTLAWIHYVGV